MAVPDHIYLRDARDRVIDLLGFGETAPLRDVTVEQDGLMVPVATPAQIEIDPGQRDVKYLLRHRGGEGLGQAYLANGTGAKTRLTTPDIDADITFKILARKVPTWKEPTGREAYLHDMAPIRVGLDTTLAVRILPIAGEPDDVVPPMVDYGSAVRVEVQLSQAGVDYELIVSPAGEATDGVVASASVPGNTASIVLDSVAMYEDVDIRVRGTRLFDSAEGREPQVVILDTVLRLNVGANRGLAVTAADPIVDYDGATTVTIGNTQESAHYQVLLRLLRRADNVYEDGAEPALRVAVPDEPDVLIRPPSPVEPLGDYTILGPAVTGTGGDLSFDVESVLEDTLLIVIAGKTHATQQSVVQLDQAAVVLARPNAHQELSLRIPLKNGRMAGTVGVSGGQPGVFYYVRRDASGAGIGELRIGVDFAIAGEGVAAVPAYFPDTRDFGGGVGEMRVGLDLVVGGEGDPVIPIDGPVLPARLYVRAVKARTLVAVQLARDATVSALPEIMLDRDDIVAGGRARIVVVASIAGERYQPFFGGAPLRPARIGNGSDLVFRSDSLTDDASVVMSAKTAPTHLGLAVERRIGLDFHVWPVLDARVLAPPLDPSTTGATSPRLIDWGDPVEVEIAATERRFEYEVADVSGSAPVVVSMRKVSGSGDRITIETRPLAEDSVLKIRATKTSENAETTRHRILDPALPVAVRANPRLELSMSDIVVGHAGDAVVAIEDSQPSAAYTVYTKPLSDDDLFPADFEQTATFNVDGIPISLVTPVAGGGGGSVPPHGFAAVGPSQPGTGSELREQLTALRDDIHVFVTATKDHLGRESVVALQQPLAVFVRPDSAPGLKLTAGVSGGRIATLLVGGGQPGVFYYFRSGAQGVEGGNPVYFHRHDGDGNRGVERLRIGVDFTVARDVDGAGRPLDPMLVLSAPGELDTTWHVRAFKGLTGVAVALAKTARIGKLPEIAPESAEVAVGMPARIAIRSSVQEETYSLYRGGVATGDVVVGDGLDLAFVTEPLKTDTAFQVGASRPQDPGIPVERRVTVPVEVVGQ